MAKTDFEATVRRTHAGQDLFGKAKQTNHKNKSYKYAEGGSVIRGDEPEDKLTVEDLPYRSMQYLPDWGKKVMDAIPSPISRHDVDRAFLHDYKREKKEERLRENARENARK